MLAASPASRLLRRRQARAAARRHTVMAAERDADIIPKKESAAPRRHAMSFSVHNADASFAARCVLLMAYSQRPPRCAQNARLMTP